MRKLYILTALLSMLAFLPACENDDVVNGSIETTVSVLNKLTEQNYLLDEPTTETEDPFQFRLTWSKARFFYESGEIAYVDGLSYEIQADIADSSFMHPVVLATTTDLYTDLYTKELNAAVLTLAGEKNTATQNLAVRVKVSYTGGESSFSEHIVVTVKPYVHVDITPFKYIYVIGNMNGWDNSNKDYMAFKDNSDPLSGVYTYTGYFTTECYLKFSPEENIGSWDNMYYAGADGVLIKGASEGGAFYAAPGYHTFTIDINNMTWSDATFDGSASKTFTQMGPIGGFCAWDNEPLLTNSTYDVHQWRGTFTFDAATTVKFRGDKDWANNWGDIASNLPFGKAYFDGAGADVTEAGTYDIYFNDLTGHYVIKKQVVL